MPKQKRITGSQNQENDIVKGKKFPAATNSTRKKKGRPEDRRAKLQERGRKAISKKFRGLDARMLLSMSSLEGVSEVDTRAGSAGRDKVDVRSGSQSSLRNWISNPDAASNEVELTLTDYFDYADMKASGVYLLGLNSIPNMRSIYQQTDMVGAGTRIRRVRVYALPRFALDTATSAALVLFGVPTSMSQALGGQINFVYLGQKATLLTPTSVSDWVMVGSYEFDNLFGVTGYEPVVTEVKDSLQPMTNLFEVQLLNPDDFSNLEIDCQFRVEVEYAAAVPLISQSLVAIEATTIPWDGGFGIAYNPAPSKVLINPLKVRNAI